MRNLTLYRALTDGTYLTNSSPATDYLSNYSSPDPDFTSCIFLEKGHIMEYVQAGARKVVSLFFGPEEYVIPCHPLFSSLRSLDPVTTITFTHRNIFRTLRQFPESSAQYQGIRKQYQEKVDERLRVQQMMSVQERFDYLQERQPWVFALVSRPDIASYLGITLDELRQLSK